MRVYINIYFSYVDRIYEVFEWFIFGVGMVFNIINIVII